MSKLWTFSVHSIALTHSISFGGVFPFIMCALFSFSSIVASCSKCVNGVCVCAYAMASFIVCSTIKIKLSLVFISIWRKGVKIEVGQTGAELAVAKKKPSLLSATNSLASSQKQKDKIEVNRRKDK